MLYDDSEQLEVRHVISLAHYDVDIYGGGEKIPEGELWIKRNCIRLRKRVESQPDDALPDAKPFFLFSDNCSEKEDFYHAILQSQDQRADAPKPLKFDTPDLVRLVQQLHASEEYLHTRWINAIIGRLFLALYKTDQVEQFIWNKITKKISRVPKPALISKINLQKIDMGTLPPFITNPKLRELTVDGDMTVEADVSYKGNFRVEISAIARIELGSRFKAREVTLVLATTLKKLEGHILVRIKPPPSNRMWVTFETAPKMELSVEPIVSSRQITYGVILRAIESRLREVVSETLVLPNWDDLPFKDTELNPFRGGIWTNDAKKEHDPVPLDTLVEPEALLEEDTELRSPPISSSESIDSNSTISSAATTTTRPSIKPKAMRSGSFASASSPVVNVDSSNVSATRSPQREGHDDAASTMKTISRSQPTSPAHTTIGSPAQASPMPASPMPESRRSTSPAGFEAGQDQKPDDNESHISLPSPANAPSKHGSSLSLPRNTFATNERRQFINNSLNSATAAAKKWFANRQAASNVNSPTSPYPKSSDNNKTRDDAVSNDSQSDLSVASGVEINAPLGSPANPIGRGQPIPEGGVPPSSRPEKSGWSVPSAATIANLTRRKPTPAQTQASASQPQHPQSPGPTPTIIEHQESAGAVHEPHRSPAPVPLPTAHLATPSNSNPKSQGRPTHGHERKTSVGTAAMGVRRKSSAVPPHKPMSNPPRHRPRRSVTESAGSDFRASRSRGDGFGGGGGGGGGAEEGVLVVEAPEDTGKSGSPAPGPGLAAEGDVVGSWAEKRDRERGRRRRTASEPEGGNGNGNGTGNGKAGTDQGIV
jgi:hypothetical protein